MIYCLEWYPTRGADKFAGDTERRVVGDATAIRDLYWTLLDSGFPHVTVHEIDGRQVDVKQELAE